MIQHVLCTWVPVCAVYSWCSIQCNSVYNTVCCMCTEVPQASCVECQVVAVDKNACSCSLQWHHLHLMYSDKDFIPANFTIVICKLWLFRLSAVLYTCFLFWTHSHFYVTWLQTFESRRYCWIECLWTIEHTNKSFLNQCCFASSVNAVFRLSRVSSGPRCSDWWSTLLVCLIVQSNWLSMPNSFHDKGIVDLIAGD